MKKQPLLTLLITLLGCSLLLPGLSAWRTAANTDATTLLILGDSISAAQGIQRQLGWVELLQRRLALENPEVAVINASVSGETTQGGIARLPLLLATHHPQIVVIELGGNDGLRGYPTRKIQQNLETLVSHSMASGAQVLLVGMHIPPNYGPRYTAAFHAAFVDAAQTYNTLLVPFLLENVASQPGLMQNDGIHPTADAQPTMLDTAWPYIQQILDSVRETLGKTP